LQYKTYLVWTDLKAENFVVMQDFSNGEKVHPKGIDLESAMPYWDNPVDYSPESCPPNLRPPLCRATDPFLNWTFPTTFGPMGYSCTNLPLEKVPLMARPLLK
jgi:hypothetical protein